MGIYGSLLLESFDQININESVFSTSRKGKDIKSRILEYLEDKKEKNIEKTIINNRQYKGYNDGISKDIINYIGKLFDHYYSSNIKYSSFKPEVTIPETPIKIGKKIELYTNSIIGISDNYIYNITLSHTPSFVTLMGFSEINCEDTNTPKDVVVEIIKSLDKYGNGKKFTLSKNRLKVTDDQNSTEAGKKIVDIDKIYSSISDYCEKKYPSIKVSVDGVIYGIKFKKK